jgi:hypothetical protein
MIVHHYVAQNAVKKMKSVAMAFALHLAQFAALMARTALQVKFVLTVKVVAYQMVQSAVETTLIVLQVKRVVVENAYLKVQFAVHQWMELIVMLVSNVLIAEEVVFQKKHFAVQIPPIAMQMRHAAIVRVFLLVLNVAVMEDFATLEKNVHHVVQMVA